jgi:hypothetical protein
MAPFLGGIVPSVFFSYSHADEKLRDQLDKQLSLLKRQGVIETWHDRRIGAGEELVRAIDTKIESCDIILLLVSSDFLNSDYCYDVEMTRAMERHAAGSAVVIPVILRPCLWHDAPFGKLMATPRDGKPVTQHPDHDAAFLEIAQAVKQAAERLRKKSGTTATPPSMANRNPPVSANVVSPRSSNLRLTKTFTDRDKDQFQHEAFDYIAAYFANSLAELEARNTGIEGSVRRISENRFTASVYKVGKAIARCTIFIGSGFFGNGISYVQGETDASNTANETLRIEADDQMLYLTSMGMSFTGSGRQQKLSMEGAAELLWSIFIQPLQSGD